MSQDVPWAEHSKMDRRGLLAREFFEVTGAEVIPFVSDEATWYAFDYLDAVELVALLESHFGVALDKSALALPFWQLLDRLAVNRTRAKA
jgi:acyl carrier protein